MKKVLLRVIRKAPAKKSWVAATIMDPSCGGYAFGVEGKVHISPRGADCLFLLLHVRRSDEPDPHSTGYGEHCRSGNSFLGEESA